MSKPTDNDAANTIAQAFGSDFVVVSIASILPAQACAARDQRRPAGARAHHTMLQAKRSSRLHKLATQRLRRPHSHQRYRHMAFDLATTPNSEDFSLRQQRIRRPRSIQQILILLVHPLLLKI
jgi:hypothetical protein